MDPVQIWLRQQRLNTVPTQHHGDKPWAEVAIVDPANLHQHPHDSKWPSDFPGHPQRPHIGGSSASKQRPGHGGNRYGTATNLS